MISRELWMRETLGAAKEVVNVFALFALRAGVTDANGTLLTEEQVRNELYYMSRCNSMKEYLFQTRVGETFPLTRKIRLDLWSLYKNAERHAATDIAGLGVAFVRR